MNWKIFAIIAATALATAAAVAFVLQKQSCKRSKVRFDSDDFDDDDEFMDDIVCAEQCSYMDDSVELNTKHDDTDKKQDDAETVEKVEEAVEQAAEAVEDAVEDAVDDFKNIINP